MELSKYININKPKTIVSPKTTTMTTTTIIFILFSSFYQGTNAVIPGQLSDENNPDTDTHSNFRDDNDEATQIRLTWIYVFLIIATLGALIVFIVMAFCVFFLIKRPDTLRKFVQKLLQDTSANVSETSIESHSQGQHPSANDLSKKVILLNQIGGSRYSSVWHGAWIAAEDRGPIVAKIISSQNEHLYKREKNIYLAMEINQHENILRPVGYCVTSYRQHTENWLLLPYYSLGSLFDYLNRKQLTKEEIWSIYESIVGGLAYLHKKTRGTKGKPAIAHRDFKSNNILIGENGKCVIADFGLAVKDESKLDLGENPYAGTTRYMSPEILNKSINVKDFKSFQKADIYSFALVMWEVCQTTSGTYKKPYEGMVEKSPKVKEMEEVVCKGERRPDIPVLWKKDKLLNHMSELIGDCWHKDPKKRLTADKIWQKLKDFNKKGFDRTKD